MGSSQATPITLSDPIVSQAVSSRRLLTQLLRITAVALILSALLFLLQDNFTGDVIALTCFYGLFLGSIALLVHTNRILVAAHLFTAVAWLSLTLHLTLFGIDATPTLGAYLVIILIAALLLRGKATIVYTVLSIVAGLSLAFAMGIGRIPLYAPLLGPAITIGNSFPKLFSILALLGIAFCALHFTLATLRFNEHDLKQIRQTLGQRTVDLSIINEQLRHEISERQHTTEALREKEENFRALVEASFDGIIICADHIILEANPRFATMFGCATIDEVLGKKAATFVTAESSTALQKLMETSSKISLEVTGVCQDGSTFPIEIVSHPINYQGKLAHISGYRDISSRKRAEEAEQHAKKLEGLRIMAGGLAHDFNNLLVAMMSQVTIAKARLNPDHPSHNNLDKAIQATETAALLTRQLLAYTGQGHFEVKGLHLNQLIAQNLQLFQEALPANISFHRSLSEPLPHIQADSAQIQQILMNLLLNGAEAIGTKEGTITITTAPYQLTAEQIDQWQPINETVALGSYVLLEVADSGCGMDEATLNRVFDPFYSTKGTGHGLGLSAVLGIVRGHNGSLRVESQPSKGTSFQFLFPSDESEQLGDDSDMSTSHPYHNTILIIDDEKQVREAIGDILDLKEIPSLAAASGQEGLALFEAHQDKVGLIILDLTMPGMSGLDTFKALRHLNPTAKIILSSGFTEGEVLQKMDGIRPNGFLQKPYRLETVLHTVEKYLL